MTSTGGYGWMYDITNHSGACSFFLPQDMAATLKRARRDCPLCGGNYARLPNHLRDTHQLSGEERKEQLKVAKIKTPDLRLLSKLWPRGVPSLPSHDCMAH